MKKKYVKPIVKVIKLKKEDVITTSTPHNPSDDLFGEGKDGVKL